MLPHEGNVLLSQVLRQHHHTDQSARLAVLSAQDHLPIAEGIDGAAEGGGSEDEALVLVILRRRHRALTTTERPAVARALRGWTSPQQVRGATGGEGAAEELPDEIETPTPLRHQRHHRHQPQQRPTTTRPTSRHAEGVRTL